MGPQLGHRSYRRRFSCTVVDRRSDNRFHSSLDSGGLPACQPVAYGGSGSRSHVCGMNWISILVGTIGAVLAWFIANWVGKPIIDVRDKRIKALQAAEQNAFVGYGVINERVAAARAALNEAASGLRSISRGHGWPVRLYCRFAQYDLEAAANWLINLHNMAGEMYEDKRRQIALDAIYIFLRAHQHLSRERVDEI